MYTAAMGAGDHDRALTTARAVLDLPAAPDDLHTVVVHATDTPETVDGVVERVTELPGENGVETTVEAAEHDADLLRVGGRRHSPAGKVQLRDGAQSAILNTDRCWSRANRTSVPPDIVRTFPHRAPDRLPTDYNGR